MKTTFIALCICSLFLVTSCSENNTVKNTNNTTTEQQIIEKSEENTKTETSSNTENDKNKNKTIQKEELEDTNHEKEISSTSTTDTEKEEVVKKEKKKKYIPTEEDIQLAGCEETKTAGKVEWCLKNTELVKEVGSYGTRFSKSVKNDSGFKGIYENEDGDKLYTFRYLEQACGFIPEEGLLTDETVKETCPCPVGYSVPTPKQWKDTYAFYSENIELMKDELDILKDRNIIMRDDRGNFFPDSPGTYFHSHAYGVNKGRVQQAWLGKYDFSLEDDTYNMNAAHPLRCVKITK